MAKKTEQNSTKKQCLKCLTFKDKKNGFYKSNSTLFADEFFPVCKNCIKSELKLDDPYSKEAIDSLKLILQQMNRPFLYNLWEISIDESQRTKRELFGTYWKNLQLNCSAYTWNESDFDVGNVKITQSNNDSEDYSIEIIDKHDLKFKSQDKADIIRMLGYDPFEFENEEDKPKLYADLVNFLMDESVLEDGFKLQACIQLVTGFNQVNKINNAITQITNDPEKMSKTSGGIKTLIDAKSNILQSLVKLAAENGLSEKHNTQKSKGAGTLSWIIKQLNEQGIEDATLNLFDIETAEGMRQVAGMSNESIMKQLQFDENDYTQMIVEQRELIQELDSKVIALEEENRKLRKQLIEYEKLQKQWLVHL